MSKTFIFRQPQFIIKAGAGSRGGVVLGTTRSGKPIYAPKNRTPAKTPDFTPEDHADAAATHFAQGFSVRHSKGHADHHAFASGRHDGQSIGQTKSGKAIPHPHSHQYQRDHKTKSDPAHSLQVHERTGFTGEDHKDAAAAHLAAYQSKKDMPGRAHEADGHSMAYMSHDHMAIKLGAR